MGIAICLQLELWKNDAQSIHQVTAREPLTEFTDQHLNGRGGLPFDTGDDSFKAIPTNSLLLPYNKAQRMDGIASPINCERKAFAMIYQVHHPLLGDGKRMVINNVIELLEVRPPKRSLWITVELIQLCLAYLHCSNVIRYKDVSRLCKPHQ
jgi:hypothetical protein